MPDSTSNLPGVEVGRHPQWCSPLACHDTDKDTHHASTPVPLVVGGQMYEFALRQMVEHAFPEEPGEVRLAVDVTDMEITGADVQFEVPVQHLDQLIERLVIERNRARFLAAPVARAAAVAS